MFFTAIHQMMTEGVDLTLVIRKANGQLTVSLLPKSNGLKDEAQNHLVPLTVSGLPQELDAGFLQAVARPIQKTTGLISNMAQFEAQAEKAASESKAAKETKAKETKEEKEKREKYEKHFKKAEELIAAKNHKEAVTALGQARLYAKPQDQKKIDEMVAEQTKAMNKGSLFELMDEPAPQPQQPQAQPAAAPQQPRQAPQYPPQPQAQRPMATQAPGGQQRPAAGPQQQQAMWPPQQPPQGPAQYYQPQPQPYMGQQPVPQQVPQPAHGGYHGTHWQEPEELVSHYHAGEDEPNYRPEDYEEYPDFPQSMLENHVSQYQAV
jgi:PRTRC genetic system protein E